MGMGGWKDSLVSEVLFLIHGYSRAMFSAFVLFLLQGMIIRDIAWSTSLAA